MKRIQVSSGTYLTSNLVNDISNYLISNIKDLAKTFFKGGVVFQDIGNPLNLVPQIQGQQIKVTIGPGKLVFQDGTVIEVNQTNPPIEIMITPPNLKIGARYNFINGNPSYRKEVQIEFFSTNQNIVLENNEICLGEIVLTDTGVEVNYSNRHWFSFSTNIQFLIKLPEGPSSNLITSQYFFNQEVTIAQHLRALGSGTVTPKNPHGLSLRDIEGWTETKLTETHENQLHKNGIIFSPLSTKTIFFKENFITSTTNFQYVRIQFPSNSLLFLNGKTFDQSLFKTFDIFLGKFQNGEILSTLPSSTYLIALKNNNLELEPYVFSTRENISGEFSWKLHNQNIWTFSSVLNIFDPRIYFPICLITWDSNSRTFNFEYPGDSYSMNLLYPEANDYSKVGDVKLFPISVNLNNLDRTLLPLGWAYCAGKALYKKIFPELYSIIGGSYGEDQYYFNLPLLNYSFGGKSYIYIIKAF